jgi:hypothetical protein
MAAAFVDFDWDDGNRAKCQKHGVSLGEIGKRGRDSFPEIEKGDATLFQRSGKKGTGKRGRDSFPIGKKGTRLFSKPVGHRFGLRLQLT